MLYKTFFITLFYTGMRKSEARALQWKDIKVNDKHNLLEIKIDKSISEKSAKELGIACLPKQTKTSSSNRVCLCLKEDVQVLEEFKYLLEKLELFKEDEYVFKDYFVSEPKPIPLTIYIITAIEVKHSIVRLLHVCLLHIKRL